MFPYSYSYWVFCDIFTVQFQYLKLRALQRQSYTHYFYEATVGAGLPIISTLRGLLETGDKILQIEGIFRFCYVETLMFFPFLRLLDFWGWGLGMNNIEHSHPPFPWPKKKEEEKVTPDGPFKTNYWCLLLYIWLTKEKRGKKNCIPYTHLLFAVAVELWVTSSTTLWVK